MRSRASTSTRISVSVSSSSSFRISLSTSLTDLFSFRRSNHVASIAGLSIESPRLFKQEDSSKATEKSFASSEKFRKKGGWPERREELRVQASACIDVSEPRAVATGSYRLRLFDDGFSPG